MDRSRISAIPDTPNSCGDQENVLADCLALVMAPPMSCFRDGAARGRSHAERVPTRIEPRHVFLNFFEDGFVTMTLVHRSHSWGSGALIPSEGNLLLKLLNRGLVASTRQLLRRAAASRRPHIAKVSPGVTSRPTRLERRKRQPG